MKRKLQVGFDFDGVIAYNPFRIVRAPISFVKRKFFKTKKLSFYYPKNRFEREIWKIMHESSIFPARGIDLFKELVVSGHIEAHLITARYSYLDAQLFVWLKRHKLEKYFKSVNWNKHDEQPHLFKEKMVKVKKLDYFIEDNLDIVRYLSKNPKSEIRKPKTKVFWIYNILDRNYPHPHKYPHLREALEDIILRSKLT